MLPAIDHREHLDLVLRLTPPGGGVARIIVALLPFVVDWGDVGIKSFLGYPWEVAGPK